MYCSASWVICSTIQLINFCETISAGFWGKEVHVKCISRHVGFGIKIAESCWKSFLLTAIVLLVFPSVGLAKVGNPERASLRDSSTERVASELSSEFVTSKFGTEARAKFDGYYGVLTHYRRLDPKAPTDVADVVVDGSQALKSFLRERQHFFGLSDDDIESLIITVVPHTAPSLKGRYLSIEATQQHSGIRLMGTGAKIIATTDGEIRSYQGLLAPGSFVESSITSSVSKLVSTIAKHEGKTVFDDILSATPREKNRYKLFEGPVRIANAELIYYPKGKDFAPGWLVTTLTENPFVYLLDGEGESIVGASGRILSAAYGSHFDRFCGSPDEDIYCENPFSRSYGDPGIPDSWPCFDVDCGDTNDPMYTLCCTPNPTARSRVDTEYTGNDGDWTYVDPNDSQHRLSYGNNTFVARNYGPCGTGACDDGLPACRDPESVIACKTPLSDHNFTSTVGYTHDLDYSSDYLNPSLAAESPAAVSNGFYWMNWYHDFLYDLGFTEAAKNFQFSNYGRGGEEGDGVVLSVQYEDLLGICAIAFGGPVSLTPNYLDGDIGAIYMCPYGAEQELDVHFNADILLHEYQHLVTNRLVGESCFGYDWDDQFFLSAMAEGWSDYFPLTTFTAVIGESLPYSWDSAYKTGCRSIRYDQSSLTLRDLILASNEQHENGEIWASTLYDVRNWTGRKIYTFDASKWQQYAKDLVDETILWAMNLGCDGELPSFLKERNNILEYDDLYHIPQGEAPNRNIIWKTFAKRGMGVSACVGYCVDGEGSCSCTSPVYLDGEYRCPCDKGNNNSHFTPGLIGTSADMYAAAAFDVPKSARFVENHEYLVPDSGWKNGLGDDSEVNVTLPYCFPFFGEGCSRHIRIGANGGIKFDTYTGDVGYSSTNFPTTSSSAPNIAPMWTDFNPGASTTDSNDVYFGCYFPGDDPVTTQYQAYCVVSWHNISHYNGGAPSSFQAVLFPSGNIIFRYESVGYTYYPVMGLNKGDGSGYVTPWGDRQSSTPISSGDSVAFIYDAVSGTYRYERSDSATWLVRILTATKLSMSDNSEAVVSLPFDFPFTSSLGTTYSSAVIGTNGGLRFGTSGEIGYYNVNLPAISEGSVYGYPHLAVFWDDLNFNTLTGGIYWNSSPSAQMAAATWQNVYQKSNSNNVYTGQAVMFDTGDIVYHYGDLGTVYSVTTGINDPFDPNEPDTISSTGVSTIHTKFYSQYGYSLAPLITSNTAHYYFVSEREY